MRVWGIEIAKPASRLFVIALCSIGLTGCAMSSISSPFGSSEKKQNSWEAQVTEASLLEAAKNDTGGGYDIASAAIHCPRVTIRPGERLLTIYEIGRVGDGLAIQHRGEITKTARECRISPNRIEIKYGFAGRVLLGPKGKPGTFRLPLKVSLADRTQTVVATQKAEITVTITPDNPIGYFSAVREISIPLPPGVPPSDYQLYVAFERTDPGAG